MSTSLATIDLRPSSELMLALDAVVQSFNRLASAIEASNEIGAVSVIEQTRASIGTEYQRGGGRAETPVKATTAVLEQPAKAPANAEVAPVNRATAERPPVSGNTSMRPVVFSPERNEIIRREWPRGTSVTDILSMVNALPGPPTEGRRLGIQAAGTLGVKRPAAQAATPSATLTERVRVDLSGLSALGAVTERKLDPVAPTPAPKPPVVAPQPASRMDAIAAVSKAIEARPAPADPCEPVFAGYEHVRSWAGERGIQFKTWDDLPTVNSRRERLGLACFKREFSGRGVFG